MSLLGSALGAVGSIVAGNSAAGAAQAAANASNRRIREAGNLATQDLAPYTSTGRSAANALTAFIPAPGQSLGDMVANSPGYKFELAQGQNQLDRIAGRSGNLFSGRALQGATEFGQNFAGTKFWQYIDQLNRMAGSGQNAATALGNIRSGNAAQMGANTMAAGDMRASAYLNGGNALNSLINNYYYGQGRAGQGQGGPNG